jgi:cytochrome c5
MFNKWQWGSRIWAWASTLVIVGLASCGVEQAEEASSTPPVQQDALLLASAKVGLPPAGVTLADLPEPGSQGAELVSRYCTPCHALPSPGSHSVTDWPVYLRRMWLRTELLDSSFGVPVPTNAERIVLQEYLLTHAFQVSGETLPGGPGRDIFMSKCSQCHALPDPAQHSPEDWIAVVTRMRQRMENMLGVQLTRDEYQRIILFLESASRAM